MNRQTNLEFAGDDFKTKLVCIGSDGAAVMQGHKGGVTGLLVKEQPLVQSIHCTSHRLELAYKDVIKDCPKLLRVHTTLEAIYNFYHRSFLDKVR